jgi:uncharacterized membrane protein (UPF0127 family)
MDKRLRLSFILVLFLASGALEAAPAFEKIRIKLGSRVLKVELADTPEKLSYGLMHRHSMGVDDGMLFIFREEQTLSFWMKNTFVDLSIAFFSKEKVLIEIQDMKAAKSVLQTKFESYLSTRPAQYALEMRRGWFLKNQIKVGTKLEILPQK